MRKPAIGTAEAFNNHFERFYDAYRPFMHKESKRTNFTKYLRELSRAASPLLALLADEIVIGETWDNDIEAWDTVKKESYPQRGLLLSASRRPSKKGEVITYILENGDLVQVHCQKYSYRVWRPGASTGSWKGDVKPINIVGSEPNIIRDYADLLYDTLVNLAAKVPKKALGESVRILLNKIEKNRWDTPSFSMEEDGIKHIDELMSKGSAASIRSIFQLYASHDSFLPQVRTYARNVLGESAKARAFVQSLIQDVPPNDSHLERKIEYLGLFKREKWAQDFLKSIWKRYRKEHNVFYLRIWIETALGRSLHWWERI